VITNELGVEMRPTEKRVLHVTIALVDYTALVDENKRLREALERAKERLQEWADRTIFTEDDQDEFAADVAQINAIAGFLDAPRA
jgi:hypothetical protein